MSTICAYCYERFDRKCIDNCYDCKDPIHNLNAKCNCQCVHVNKLYQDNDKTFCNMKCYEKYDLEHCDDTNTKFKLYDDCEYCNEQTFIVEDDFGHACEKCKSIIKLYKSRHVNLDLMHNMHNIL
jgi:hypothetical protein